MFRAVFVFSFVLFFSGFAVAEKIFIKANDNWLVQVDRDDFTDKKSCTVNPVNQEYSSIEKIYILVRSPSDEEVSRALVGSNTHISDIGFRYRVDDNAPVVLGEDYKYPSYADMYVIEGREFEKMISSFKAGRELVYQFMSGNNPANKKVYRFSLMGFSEAYYLAKRCDSL